MAERKNKKEMEAARARARDGLASCGWREDARLLEAKIFRVDMSIHNWVSEAGGADSWARKPILKALLDPGSDMEASCAGVDPKWFEWPLWRLLGAPAKKAVRASGIIAYDMVKLAASMGRVDAVEAMMARGASANRFSEGVTAVGLAGYHGHAGVLAAMLGHGADLRLEILPEHAPGRRDQHGSTLLKRVCERGCERSGALDPVLRVLLSDRVSYPEAASPGEPPAWLAACPQDSKEAFAQAWAWTRSVSEREMLDEQAMPAASRVGRPQAL